MRFRDSFLYLVRGVLLGISSLVPGVSVSSISVSLGAYEDFITNIWQILKRKKNATYIIMIPLIIGILAGIFGGVHVVNFFFTKYKVQTIFFFVGLLSGGYRLTIKNARLKLNLKCLLVFLISFVIALLFQMLIINRFSITSSNSYLNNFFTGMLSGIIFLLPGVSTSSVLLFFNKYKYLIDSFNHLLNIHNLLVVLLFILGVTVSILIISRVISHFLERFKETVNIIICGFVTSSVVIAILEVDAVPLKFSAIFPSILLFLWGYIFTKNLAKE